jgi:hypothetical protein
MFFLLSYKLCLTAITVLSTKQEYNLYSQNPITKALLHVSGMSPATACLDYTSH